MESNIYFCTPCIIMSSIVATLCMGFIYCALTFLSNESGTLVTFLFDFFYVCSTGKCGGHSRSVQDI